MEVLSQLPVYLSGGLGVNDENVILIKYIYLNMYTYPQFVFVFCFFYCFIYLLGGVYVSPNYKFTELQGSWVFLSLSLCNRKSQHPYDLYYIYKLISDFLFYE